MFIETRFKSPHIHASTSEGVASVWTHFYGNTEFAHIHASTSEGVARA